jgi:DNA primase
LIPDAKIDEIRDRTDIVRVVADHVELKRKGQNWFGLCPFHSEKTPSFSVHAQKQMFHCFGCHETGDVFGFLMRVEGRPFGEVARDLANRAGVDLPESSPERDPGARERRSERERCLEVNALVAGLYRQMLGAEQGAPGRAYLREREIRDDVIESFQLGYAPQAWDTLSGALARLDVPPQLGEKLGLIAPRRGGQGHYDRFRGRIIFPLIGPAGEVLGFGGRRTIDGGDEPKYINTPETPVYRKGESLYGLHAARQAIRHEGRALLVEGNIDVLSLHQAGHRNAVAPMGTALTERQARLVRRFAPGVTVMFDGDAAGRKAALAAVPRLLAEDVDARIASLGDGEDPDSLARRGGGEAVAACLRAAVPAVDFALQEILARTERTIPGRVRAIEEAAPLLLAVPNASARDLYAGKLAAALDLDVGHVYRALRGAAPQVAEARPAGQVRDLPPAEAQLLALLADHPELAPLAGAAGVLGLVEDDAARRVLGCTLAAASAGRLDVAAILADAPEDRREAVARALLSSSFAGCEDPARALRECLARLLGRSLERRAAEMRRESRRAEETGDRGRARELALQAVDLDRQRRAAIENHERHPGGGDVGVQNEPRGDR